MESLAGSDSPTPSLDYASTLTLNDSYSVNLSDEDISEVLRDFKSSYDSRKSAVDVRITKEIHRLQAFFEDSLSQISCQKEALYKQVDEFITMTRTDLTEQVSNIRLVLETASSATNYGTAGNNAIYSHLTSLETLEDIDRSELLELKFQMNKCDIESVLLKSVDLSVIFHILSDEVVTEANSKKSNEGLGKVERAGPIKVLKKPSTIEISRVKNDSKAAESSKIGSSIKSKNSSRISSTKASPIQVQTSLPDQKDTTKLAPQKATSKLQIRSPKETAAKSPNSIGKDRNPIQTQKLLVQYAANATKEPIYKSVDLQDKDNESPLKTSSRLSSKMNSPFQYEGPKESNEAGRKRASALRNTLNRPLSTSKASRSSNPPDSLDQSLTERTSNGRMSLILPKNSIKINIEEAKTLKEERVTRRNSLQLGSPELSSNKSNKLKSPNRDIKKLPSPRSPMTPSPGQFLTYFIPFTCKVLIFQLDTESVITVEIEMPEAFYEGAAWCETMTQEVLYTGGYSELPLNKAWLISSQKRSFLEVSPMIKARHSHQLCALNDLVFAIGGAGPEPLDDCEYFSMRTCTWKKAGSLNFPRISPAACVHNGRIYVAGGQDQNSIETYDQAEDCFNLLFILLPYSGLASMSNYNETLLIFQGSHVTEISLSTNSFAEVCPWKSSQCWSPTTLLYLDGLVYMLVEGEFMRFNISTLSVEKL